jgi:hypothetical protein
MIQSWVDRTFIPHSALCERRGMMATHVVFHEVDDVDHWLASSNREEVFGPLGISMRTFRDPAGSSRVGLIAEIPDMAAFQAFMQTDAAAAAMKADGVRPESLLVLDQG